MPAAHTRVEMRNDADFQIPEFPVLAGFAAVVVTSFAACGLEAACAPSWKFPAQ